MTIELNPECLIIGAKGLVGRQLGKLLTAKGITWKGTYNKRVQPGLLKLDITNPSQIKEIFTETMPKAVFFCANLAGGVDFCQSHPQIAREFHLEATKNIATQCKAMDVIFIYLSTDYIFDGTKDFYKEEDVPNPLNLYGKLKLTAEEYIRSNLKRYLIIRTMNIYGWDPDTVTPNYIMNLYRVLREGRLFYAPAYLWGNPTYVNDLAKAIVELYAKGVSGIFHIAGKSFVNRLEWAKDACNTLGLDFSLVNEIESPKPDMIPRPLKSCLNTDKFTKSYETILYDLASGLEFMKQDIEKDLYK